MIRAECWDNVTLLVNAVINHRCIPSLEHSGSHGEAKSDMIDNAPVVHYLGADYNRPFLLESTTLQPATVSSYGGPVGFVLHNNVVLPTIHPDAVKIV